ncbi:MAG TPA: DNA-binding domain-containing protein, partial [Thermomonas sp.]|nr:DNA-binding domain-containing protein [Thermomonas sp.]
MSALATTQAAMHDWLRHGDPAIAARVEGPLVAHRLRIHADAYRLRLIEVLANDYPVTAALLDEDRFDDAALGYLQAHPSTHPSLRH